jgi:hypothetical protein
MKKKLNLVDLKESDVRPDIVVTAIDANSKTLHVAKVDAAGNFEVPDKVLKDAHRIVIGPGTDDPKASAASLIYRVSQFQDLLKQGALTIAPGIWQKWRFILTCVTGTVRLCRPHPWWYYDLLSLATASTVLDSRKVVSAAPELSLSTNYAFYKPLAKSVIEHIYRPIRCHTICNGTVEVFRRTCCCTPWVFDDYRFPELIRELEEVVKEIPKGPIDPNPPDPAPWLETTLLKGDTITDFALNASRDLYALRTLPKAELPAYVSERPYIYCRYSCGKPQRVAEGNINPDGRFNICWFDEAVILKRNCRYEYAYIVRQTVSGITRIIYNGVLAGEWFEGDDDARLVSRNKFAFACRPPGGQGTGAYVYLDIIGDSAESWNLKTPAQDAWNSLQPPTYNGGLVFPAASAAAAVGANLDRNWGGTLKLNYMFSEDMASVGAKYYRISISEADNNGNPVGTRHYISDGLSWEQSVPTATGVDIVYVPLGPFPAGSGANVQNNLYLIPYDVPIVPKNWSAIQYHAYLNTDDARWNDPTKRHLVTIEIFDASGKRLRPTGTPATGQPGLEGEAAFTFRRRTADTTTASVPYGALTHMFWWDNRAVVAHIEGLNLNGTAYTEECLFLTGSSSSTFGINYRAYHPNQMFQLSHGISWKRGLGGATGTLLAFPAPPPPPLAVPNLSATNVGKPPDPAGNSPTNTFAQMLSPRTKCAFTVFLSISSKTTDGDNLGNGGVTDTAAFALEITS